MVTGQQLDVLIEWNYEYQITDLIFVIFLLRKFGDKVLLPLCSVLVSVSRGSSSCERGEYILLLLLLSSEKLLTACHSSAFFSRQSSEQVGDRPAQLRVSTEQQQVITGCYLTPPTNLVQQFQGRPLPTVSLVSSCEMGGCSQKHQC